MKQNHYKVVYCDPPWSFETYSAKGKTEKSPEAHYRTTSTEELKSLPVSDWAAKDAVLLMWIVDSHLEQALDLIKAWGFTFKTIGFNWVKITKGSTPENPVPRMSLGLWTRKESEICLLATRGKPSRIGKGVRQVVLEAAREHSRKPDCVRERIEELLEGPYLEMFARTTRDGWDAFGDEVGKLDAKAVSAPAKSPKSGRVNLMDLVG